jgi:hypothetical protein
MDYKISLLTVAEQPMAAAQQRTTFKMVSREIQGLLSGPWAFVRSHPSLWIRGCNVAIYWDPPAEGSVEVGIQVTSSFEGSDDVVCSATPAAKVAMTTHFGPYSVLGQRTRRSVCGAGKTGIPSCRRTGRSTATGTMIRRRCGRM